MTKVSVIIPLYNQKEFVSDAINSVLDQTYENIEIIVVNDGSTDDPGTVLDKFKDKITIINQKNTGLSGARNTGIKNSIGEYLQFLDSDDILKKEKIEKQIDFVLKEGAVLSYCEIEYIDAFGKKTSPLDIGEIKDIFPNYYLFWKKYPTPIHSLMFHRSIFNENGMFDESLKANEDRYYLSLLAIKGISFRYLPLTGGYYRLHSRSMNTEAVLMISSAIEYYKKLNKILGDKFIRKTFGFSGYQIMCANCTRFYLREIRKGTKWDKLKIIKDLFKEEEIKLYAKPLESRFTTGKLWKMLLSSYFWRYGRFIKLPKIFKLK